MRKVVSFFSLLILTVGLYAEGELSGKFALAEGDTVVFAQGILQFNPARNIWRFAEHQWDTLTQAENALLAADYDGYIDLFAWGTSGYNNQWPYSNTTYSGETDISGTNYDWGVFNTITNGGNKAGEWRTLTSAEWNVLFSRGQEGPATVQGIYGCVLLPDNWSGMPEGLPEFVTKPLTIDEYQTANVYDAEQWNTMEKAGAVFMPSMRYWTASVASVTDQPTPPWLMATYAAYFIPAPLYVGTGGSYMTATARTSRYAVRLTKQYVPEDNTPTGIDNTSAGMQTQKTIHNGQLLLARPDGSVYNIIGVKIK